MSDLRKAAQMALEALAYINQYSLTPHNISLPAEIDTAVDALRAALAQPEPLTNGEIYTAYITATNQTLRAQDEKLALKFARTIEKAHGIGGEE